MDMDNKKKILIVEDSADLAGLYRARLDTEGFSVMLVDDGEKALATAVSFQPDLILLDVMMPQIDGFNVLDILKSTDATKGVIVVLLTALSQMKNKHQAAELGADDYLVKSETDLDGVVACVKKHLLLA